ncbi:MAG: hypothetical protein ACFCUU_06595 [Cyclobacteriaceae bacterium]
MTKIGPLSKTAPLPSLENIKDKIKHETSQQIQAPTEVQTTEPFTEVQLEEKWQVFVDKLRAEGRDREVNALSQPRTMHDATTIMIQVPNSFQLVTIEGIRQELVSFLRVELKNRDILVKSEAIKMDEQKFIYTNAEKFEHLAEKYPTLRELKKRFDLDADF